MSSGSKRILLMALNSDSDDCERKCMKLLSKDGKLIFL